MILDIVRQHGGASIESLCQELATSASTVRRDLNFLTNQGYLERSHGGATVMELERTTFEPDHEIASNVAHAAKVAVGVLAASNVKSGQSVIFDSGSTVLEAAKWVARRDTGITAVTNDLKIATALSHARNIHILVLGGSMRPRSFTLTGDPGLSFVEGLHVDLALVGAHSLADGMLSETSTDVAMIKRRIIAAARRTVVLADSTKFAAPSFTKVCDLSDVDEVVTDSDATEAMLEMLRKAGLTVQVAKIGRHK